MLDMGKDPHQPCGAVTTGVFAVCVYGGQITHVGTGVLAIRGALINRRRVLEVSSVVAEQNAILHCSHRKNLFQ